MDILIILILIICIPFIVLYLLYRILNKKYPQKPYKYIVFLPLAFLIYAICVSIFPNEDFYKINFKEVTNLEFPKSGEFIYKSSTFPDHFGDYTSVFLIKTNKEDYSEILKYVETKSDLEETEDIPIHLVETRIGLEKTKAKIKKQFKYNQEGGKAFHLSFFDDNKSMLIIRISW